MRFLRSYIAVTMALFALSIDCAHARSLEALDRIAEEAGTLKTFLARPALQERYFVELTRYMGLPREDRTLQESYERIIRQLREATDRIPGLADRLWTPNENPIRMSIDVNIRSYGRQIDPDLWYDFEADLFKKLSGYAVRQQAISETEYWKAEIDSLDAELDARMRTVEEAGYVPRRKAKEIAKIRLDPDLGPRIKAAGAYLLWSHLADPSTRVQLGQNADSTIHALDLLRTEPGKKIKMPGSTATPNTLILSEVSDNIPSLNRLLDTKVSKKPLFPHKTVTTRRGTFRVVGKTRQSEIIFEAPRRAFHGIWKGFKFDDCRGGGCKLLQGVKGITPRRWATVAADGAQLLYVRDKRSFHGFFQAMPLQVGSKTVGSAEFISPIFSNQVVLEDGVDTSTVYDEWRKLYKEHVPKDWSGVVLGESTFSDDAGVLETVRDSPSYRLGQTVGDAAEVRIDDPILKRILAKYPHAAGAEAKYGTSMITDATVSDAGELRRIELGIDRNALSDPELWDDTIQSLPPDQQRRMLDELRLNHPRQVGILEPGDPFVSRLQAIARAGDADLRASASQVLELAPATTRTPITPTRMDPKGCFRGKMP